MNKIKVNDRVLDYRTMTEVKVRSIFTTYIGDRAVIKVMTSKGERFYDELTTV